jgi:hypothetical protein
MSYKAATIKQQTKLVGDTRHPAACHLMQNIISKQNQGNRADDDFQSPKD